MSRVKNASTPPPIRPLLRKASYASSSSDECNPPSKCLSPIPHSESNSDDDTGDDPSALDDVDLETIISSVPEPQLRTIMMRLAGGNHRFRLAILRELMALGMANSCHNPTSEHKRTTSKRRGENIQSPLSLRCTNCNQFFNPSLLTKCVFHPGRLEKEAFDFVSMAPGGQRSSVSKIVSIWSCCEDGPKSLGCTVAPNHMAAAD